MRMSLIGFVLSLGLATGCQPTLPTEMTENPVLTTNAVVPGGFFGVQHSSIRKGDARTVQFRAEGYEVDVEAIAQNDGEVRVAAPPFIRDGLVFSRGEVMVSLAGVDGTQPLFLAEMPMILSMQRGELLAELLRDAAVALEGAANNAILIDFSAATTAELDNIFALSQELRTIRDELIDRDAISLDNGDIISSFEIEMIERYLAGVLLGVTEEINRDAGATKPRNHSQLLPIDDPNFQRIFRPEDLDGFRDAVTNIQNGPAALLGAVGAGAGFVALFAGAELATVGTVAGIAIAGGTAVYAIGSGAVISRASTALLGSDASEFDFSQETLNQLGNIGANFLGAIPGRLGQLATTVTTAVGARDTFDALADLRCQNPGGNRQQSRLGDFCTFRGGGMVDPVPDDPIDNPTPTDDPATELVAAFDGFRTAAGMSGAVQTGDRLGASDVWLSGEFPNFLIHWKPELQVTAVEVFLDGALVYGVDMENRADFEFGLFPPGEERTLLSPIVYGEYGRAGTTVSVGASSPSPPIRIDGEGFDTEFVASVSGSIRRAARLTIQVQVVARDQFGDPMILPAGVIAYLAYDLNAAGDIQTQCNTFPNECVPDRD